MVKKICTDNAEWDSYICQKYSVYTKSENLK